MNKKFVTTLLCLTALSSPAWALKEPVATKEDPHIRTIAYNPNKVVPLNVVPGQTLTIQFGGGSNDRILSVFVSDKPSMRYTCGQKADSDPCPGNILALEAKKEMPPQPISVLVQHESGKKDLQIFQWSATADPPDTPYYLLKFTYPGEAAAAARTAYLKRQEEWRSIQAQRALHQTNPLPTAESRVNKSYTATGDTRLLPLQAAPVQQTATQETR